MIKKGLDPRQEPDGESSTTENLRVDRVFTPPRPVNAALAQQATRRPSGRTIPPLAADAADAELALRRQLSRLQRQLADAQRELANKDEELASEVERRREVTVAAEQLQRAHDELQDQFHELDEYRAKTAGLDQRLQDAIAAGDELKHQLELERSERASVTKQFEEANAAFERARLLWKDESSLMQEHHASELQHAAEQKRAAVEAVENQMNSALERQREKHEAELGELKSGHDRSVAALRGELEPKVAVARSLAEEIERLSSQLQAARAEHLRDVTERTELHKWEMQQQTETLAAQLDTANRQHATELAKRDEEIDAKGSALAQAERNSELREQLWEQTVNTLRESQKKLQQELSEAKEKCVQADASKWSIEQRLIATLSTQERLTEEVRSYRERLEIAEAEAKRNTLDRARFVAYLEEGLAMMGAIPPSTGEGISDQATVRGAAAEQVIKAVEQAAEQRAKPPTLPAMPKPADKPPGK